MTELHETEGDPKDSRDKRIGEILRSSGLPLAMTMLRYALEHGTFRMHDCPAKLGWSIHSGRMTMGRMQKLGLFVKSNTTARDVVYDLTHEGVIVARCLDQLTKMGTRETNQNDKHSE